MLEFYALFIFVLMLLFSLQKSSILHLLVKLNKPEISDRMYDLVETLADQQAFLHRGSFLEDVLNCNGFTPLKLAAYGGYVEVMFLFFVFTFLFRSSCS